MDFTEFFMDTLNQNNNKFTFLLSKAKKFLFILISADYRDASTNSLIENLNWLTDWCSLHSAKNVKEQPLYFGFIKKKN